MFGVGRKKSNKSVVRSVVASDSSEDDAQHRRSIQSKKSKGSKKKKNKKKAANNTMLSFDPEDGGLDNNDELQKKKSKKRKKHSSSSSKHKKSSGLGYGGLGVMMPNTSDGSEDDNDNMEIDSTPSGYDASALEKLKSEQKRSTFVKQDKKNEESAKSVDNNNNTGKDTNITSNSIVKESREEEFISLSGDNVLTGEEAMAFAKQHDENDNMEFDHGLQSPPSPPLESSTNDKSVEKKVAGIDINADMMMDVDNPSEVDEGNRQWEDITARRAGVLPPKSATSGRESRQQQANSSNSSLGKIRSSLQPTISNLDNVYSDLDTSISRHESTIFTTQEEVSTKETTLQKHGKALEYYQVLREDLATWMGALRELNGMVKKVEDAKCKLEAEMSVRRRDRFVEWGKDCTEVLESSGLLKNKVLGKDGLDTAVPSITRPNNVQVDEFGRDLSSMASISRVKRCNQRRKRCLNRLQQESSKNSNNSTSDQSAECSNDDNFDTAEIDEWKQRQKALMQAIDIIPTLVKDDYLSISNLCTLFYDWERTYPDDYKNCYADMSLVQMTSALVRLELCGLSVLDTNSTQDVIDVSEFKWFQDLKKTIRVADSAVEKETRPRKSILLEVVQKQIVDRLLDSISLDDENKDGIKQHGIYDPFSVVQTKRMCSVLSSLLKYFTSSSGNDGKIICKEIIEQILNKLISFLKHTLSRMTIPIADASKITMRGNEFVMKEGDNGFDNETTDAISYSTIVQAKEFCTLVNNTLGHWYPVLNEICEPDKVASLVQFVFADVVSLRLLPILTSLHDISSSSDINEQKKLAKTMINGILDTVKTAENGDDDWMLMTAPLRVLAEQWS